MEKRGNGEKEGRSDKTAEKCMVAWMHDCMVEQSAKGKTQNEKTRSKNQEPRFKKLQKPGEKKKTVEI
jgi:hypothetical protein